MSGDPDLTMIAAFPDDISGSVARLGARVRRSSRRVRAGRTG